MFGPGLVARSITGSGGKTSCSSAYGLLCDIYPLACASALENWDMVPPKGMRRRGATVAGLPAFLTRHHAACPLAGSLRAFRTGVRLGVRYRTHCLGYLGRSDRVSSVVSRARPALSHTATGLHRRGIVA